MFLDSCNYFNSISIIISNRRVTENSKILYNKILINFYFLEVKLFNFKIEMCWKQNFRYES